MIATIDKSGKLQIPKPIRQRFGITPQTRLNIEEFSGQIVIKIIPAVSQLVDKGGVLVFCGQCKVDLENMLAQEWTISLSLTKGLSPAISIEQKTISRNPRIILLPKTTR